MQAATAFPEPSVDVFLPVGVAGDRLFDTAHEPADGSQALAPLARLFRQEQIKNKLTDTG